MREIHWLCLSVVVNAYGSQRSREADVVQKKMFHNVNISFSDHHKCTGSIFQTSRISEIEAVSTEKS